MMPEKHQNHVRLLLPARFLKPIMLGALLLTAGLIGVYLGCGRAIKPSNDQDSLIVAQLPISYSTVTHIAEAQGYFKDVTLNYHSVSVPAGPDVVTTLRAGGDAPVIAGTIAITPVITMIAAGDHPIVLATILKSNRQAKLITFSRTGITSNPASLRGKKIGVVRNTNGDIYLSRLLKKGGLTERDVVLVNARPPELRSLIARGELDAAVLWDPFVVQAIREYHKNVEQKQTASRGDAVVLVDPSLHTLAFNIVTTREKLASSRPALTKMIAALIRAEGYIAQHPHEAQQSMESWLSLEPGDLNDFFATSEFRVELNIPDQKRWMGEELQWFRTQTPDAIVPDNFSAYLDPSLLRSIDPQRVIE